MLDPHGLAHVGIRAEDLARLSAFYEQAVGLRMIERAEGCHIFDIGQSTLLEIWSGGCASPSRKSADQQSVRVCFAVERLETSIEDLQSRGVTPSSEIGSYLGTRWVHYTDPEGNAFGLVDKHG